MMLKRLALVICVALLAGQARANHSNAADVKLRVYSNWQHNRVFLGCLNCAANDPTSVWNPASQYGWTNPTGLWSRTGIYISPGSRRSACSHPSTEPPVVFDELWGFHYTLTVDPGRRDSICNTNGAREGCAAVRALCAHA